jgi:hypothetical protein
MNPAKQATRRVFLVGRTPSTVPRAMIYQGAIVVGDSPLPPPVCVTLLGLAYIPVEGMELFHLARAGGAKSRIDRAVWLCVETTPRLVLQASI